MEVSADGSHVYFVARGMLTGGSNDRGQVAREGANNLYVFERDTRFPEGHVAFITMLPGAEAVSWGDANSRVDVTPDGRFLVFTSRAALTADDTSASGAAQVFDYDAQTGELVRISIGDRGFDDNGNRPSPTPCTAVFCSEDASIVTPGGLRTSPERLDPTMSHGGEYVFFRSPVALTPGALDDVQVGADTLEGDIPTYAQNVYEYHEGRVYLISDGRDTGQQVGPEEEESDVQLLGSDATGANVFFTTSDRLVLQDTDTQLDYYDARICTASEPCIASSTSPAECQGEACHGTPAEAPLRVGVGSVTFSGQGNLPVPVAAPRKAVVKKKHVKRKVRKRPKKKKSARRRARPRGTGRP